MRKTIWLLILVAFKHQEFIPCLHPSVIIEFKIVANASSEKNLKEKVFELPLSNTASFIVIQIAQQK